VLRHSISRPKKKEKDILRKLYAHTS